MVRSEIPNSFAMDFRRTLRVRLVPQRPGHQEIPSACLQSQKLRPSERGF
jgi:hypothetical protein